jgi:hypothetical protein
MTITVTTGLPLETDSPLGSTTRGLNGHVYAATALEPSNSPFVYEDFTASSEEVFAQFDLRIDRQTLDSWNQGSREVLLASLIDTDTDDILVGLWVKKRLGRFVWYAATTRGGGAEMYGTHLVAAGTHRVVIHATALGAAVALPLDSLAVTF